MSFNSIKVNFYNEEQNKGTISFQSNQTLKEACQKFSSINGINFNSVFFMLNRKKIKPNDYNKNLNQLVPNVKEGNLDIYVYDKDNSSENSNKNYSVIFWFKSTQIECSLESKMFDICKSFADKIGKDLSTFNFKYGKEQLNFTKTFGEIINQDEIKRKEIDIIVEEKIESKNRKNKTLIVVFSIIGFILIIIIILLTIIFFKKKNTKNKSNYNELSNYTILNDTIISSIIIESTIVNNIIFNNITINNTSNISNEENEGLDLYEGKYISYAFSAIYDINNNSESIKLFNPGKINSLYAMKIENEIMKPRSNYTFIDIGYNIIYYFLVEDILIDLSYLFSEVEAVIYFSFNQKYINKYNIINLKGMFWDCTNLTNISFFILNTQNLTDISYLFGRCYSLTTINLFGFK